MEQKQRGTRSSNLRVSGRWDPSGAQWSPTAKESEAAGVSRKPITNGDKSLKAMALALENRPAGRSSVPVDEEKEALRDRIRELEKKLYWRENRRGQRDLIGLWGVSGQGE